MKARLHVEDGGVEVLLRRAPLAVEVHPGQPLPRGAARHQDALVLSGHAASLTPY